MNTSPSHAPLPDDTNSTEALKKLTHKLSALLVEASPTNRDAIDSHTRATLLAIDYITQLREAIRLIWKAPLSTISGKEKIINPVFIQAILDAAKVAGYTYMSSEITTLVSTDDMVCPILRRNDACRLRIALCDGVTIYRGNRLVMSGLVARIDNPDNSFTLVNRRKDRLFKFTDLEIRSCSYHQGRSTVWVLDEIQDG